MQHGPANQRVFSGNEEGESRREKEPQQHHQGKGTERRDRNIRCLIMTENP